MTTEVIIIETQVKMPSVCPCPICDRTEGWLHKHHWFELDGSYHLAFICASCNCTLKSSLFGLGDHVLPPWEEQVRFVRECLQAKAEENARRNEQWDARLREKWDRIRTQVYLKEHPEIYELVKTKHARGELSYD